MNSNSTQACSHASVYNCKRQTHSHSVSKLIENAVYAILEDCVSGQTVFCCLRNFVVDVYTNLFVSTHFFSLRYRRARQKVSSVPPQLLKNLDEVFKQNAHIQTFQLIFQKKKIYFFNLLSDAICLLYQRL